MVCGILQCGTFPLPSIPRACWSIAVHPSTYSQSTWSLAAASPLGATRRGRGFTMQKAIWKGSISLSLLSSRLSTALVRLRAEASQKDRLLWHESACVCTKVGDGWRWMCVCVTRRPLLYPPSSSFSFPPGGSPPGGGVLGVPAPQPTNVGNRYIDRIRTL